jgi:hypothetical protein
VWELWNEPNIGGPGNAFWDTAGGPTDGGPEKLTAMVQDAYPKMKTADSTCTVLVGAFSPSATTGDDLDPRDYLDRMYDAGAQGYFDHLSHHPYSEPTPLANAYDWSAWSQMHVAQGTATADASTMSKPSLRQLMSAAGDGAKQIWATECGLNADNRVVGAYTADEATQAALVTELYDLWGGFSWAGVACWYNYQGHQSWSFVRADTTLRPSYAAYRDYVAEDEDDEVRLPYDEEVLADNPFLYWRLGEPSGTSATDSSGNSRTGTYNSAPTLGVAGLLTDDEDTAVTFASGNTVTRASDSAIQLNGSWAIEFVYRLESAVAGGTYPTFVNTGNGAAVGTGGWLVYINGDTGKLRLKRDNLDSYSAGGAAPVTPVSRHAIIEYDDSIDTLRFYSDGGLDGTFTSVTFATNTNTGTLTLGALAATVDEFAMYDHALGLNRAEAHAASALLGPTPEEEPGEEEPAPVFPSEPDYTPRRSWPFIVCDMDGVPLGECFASGRNMNLQLSGAATASFNIRQTDPMWSEIAAGGTTLKVYDTGGTLRFWGPIVTDEESAQGSGATVQVNAQDHATFELSKRFVGKDTAGIGVTHNVKDSGQIIADSLTTVNAEQDTGIDIGTRDAFVTRTVTYLWKNFLQMLQELGAIQQSYEWRVRYVDGTPPQVLLDLQAIAGTDLTESVFFEYGTGLHNCSAYKRVRSIQQRATHVWAVGSGNTLIAAASDPTAAGVRRHEDVVNYGDITLAGLLDALAAAHVQLRKNARQIVQLTPAPNLAPRYGVSWQIGDMVRARVMVNGSLRVNGNARVWGAQISIDENGNELAIPTLEPQ